MAALAPRRPVVTHSHDAYLSHVEVHNPYVSAVVARRLLVV